MRFVSKLCFAASVLFTALGVQAQTVLTYSDHEPLGNMRTRFLNDVFFKLVETESQGNIKIKPHWGGEIAKAHDELQAIAGGKADLITAVPEYSLKQLPLNQLFKGFMLGPTGQEQVDTVRKIYADIPEFAAEYEAQGAKPVFIATGYPASFFSTAKLTGLADIKGQTWRSQSFWQRAFLENAGAKAVSSPWGQETYAKLANGEIQGLFVNIDSAIDIKAYEHAPYALISPKFWLGHIYPVVISQTRWNALSDNDRQAFRRAADKAYARLGAVMDESYAQILKTAREQDVQLRELSAAEVAEWGKMSGYVQALDQWAKEQEQNGTPNVVKVLEQMKPHLLGK